MKKSEQIRHNYCVIDHIHKFAKLFGATVISWKKA